MDLDSMRTVARLVGPRNDTPSELVSATQNRNVRKITVRGSLGEVPSARLAPGQALCGEEDDVEIQFAEGVDGLQLTTDNQVRDIRLHATPDKRSIFNDTTVLGFGPCGEFSCANFLHGDSVGASGST